MYFFINILLFLIIPFLFWYRWRKKQFSCFIDLGIPGPKPNFFSGNMDDLITKGVAKCHIDWIKKYGNVVGYFQGSIPILLVADLEFMKNFMVVNYKNASGREWFIEDAGVPMKTFRKSAVAVVGGPYWKELRNIMSSTFTSRKLKGIIPILEKSITRLTNKIEKKIENKEYVPMKTLFSEYAFDLTMSTMFGIDDDGSEMYRKFYKDSKQLSNVPYNDIIVNFALYFPEFSTVFTLIREAKDKISYFLGRPSCFGAYKNSLSVLQLRKSNPQIQRDDFVQLLMNATYDKQKENDKTCVMKKSLSTDEVVINMMNFVLASYESTTSTLTFALYMMAKYPEIQEKVRKELNSINTNEEEVKNSFLRGIPYLDQVINETLRYYTIVRVLVTRTITGEIKWNSKTLPKNLVLQVAAYQLHHDPEYWENPETFDPDRFLPHNKQKLNPMIFQAFGYGPKNCIGMRFAYLSLRQIFTRLLTKYKFEICEETETLIEGYEHIVLKPVNELILRAIPNF
ncbi:cytochrome P450 3A2-like [Centruroides sculpturatus]|uniref:cytochrome P450 3A2-like n=1 Tax=Centruroides sculpturatus TaxID=218467 RepID=UPI000C6CBB00|nr:cytochrome P450 3A2-like [Centruroides sculpturatus]